MTILGLLGILAGLGTMILLAFRGLGMVPATLAASLVVILFNGMNVSDALVQGFGLSLIHISEPTRQVR